MMIPCLPRNFFSSFWWILSARSDGETPPVAAVVAVGVIAAGLAIGDAVGACANKLVARAMEQMQRRTNFFIEVLCSWDALNAQFGFNNFKPAEAIKRLRHAGRWTLLFPQKMRV